MKKPPTFKKLKPKKEKQPLTKEKRKELYTRLNRPVEESTFLNDFQKIMIERIFLNYEKKYNKENLKRAIWKVSNRNAKMINTNISGGLLLSCSVEPDFYLMLQELLKKITGKYQPMDEFILLLLTWFYQHYSTNLKGIPLPYMKKEKKINKNKIKHLFEERFSKYYKNII